MSQKLKILVLDDEPAITRVVGRLLRQNGYDVIELNDPLKIEELILYTNFNLVISDVTMPGMDGLAVLETIKKVKPEIPVLMLTGVTSIETAVEATKLGASEYMTKPLNNENLLRQVKNHIRVDEGLPDGMKEFIEDNLQTGNPEMAASPDKIILRDEIVSTDSIPEGLVEIKFEDILPGQFLSFPLYIQIYNKATRRHYLRKIVQENTVFTSGMKDILLKRSLGAVFIKETDYKAFLEYKNAVKATKAFQHQRIRDNKRLLLYGKAVEAVTEILNHPEDNKNLKAAINLVDDLFKTMVDDPNTYQDLFRLFRKDTATFNHSANVCLLAVSFGVYLGMKPEIVQTLGLGAMFHDVGMNRVDTRILEKHGPLTRMEWEEIKKHPERGYALLKPAVVIPVPALRIVLEHHEKPDGYGYPRGLKADKISNLARLCQIIDKFDGMTTDKPYRPAFSAGEALKRIFYEESSEKMRSVIRRFIEFLGNK